MRIPQSAVGHPLIEETTKVIIKFEYDGDNRWEYEVDEEADFPFFKVRHPEYGSDGTQLGRLPAGVLAVRLAAEIMAKYQRRSTETNSCQAQ